MLFSNILVPIVAVLGVASSAFACPIAQPGAAAVEARENQVSPDSLLGILQALQQGLNPVISDISDTVIIGGEITTSMNTLQGLFENVNTQLQGLTPTTVAASSSTDIVSTLLVIVTSVLSLTSSPSTSGVVPSDLLGGLLSTLLSLVLGLLPGQLNGLSGGLLGGLLGGLP